MILWLYDTAPVSSGGYLTPGGVILRLYDTVPFLLFADLFFAQLSQVPVSTEAGLSLTSIFRGHQTTKSAIHPSTRPPKKLQEKQGLNKVHI